MIAPGDGSGPLRFYEAAGDPTRASSWVGRDLLDRAMIHGHTLDLGDIDGDGDLDIPNKPYTWNAPRIDDLSVRHVPSRAPAALDRLRSEAADASVAIAILTAYPDFTHPDAGERARQVEDCAPESTPPCASARRNHVRGAGWIHNDFTQPAARFLEVVRRTEGTDLAILFDTANNLALGDDPIGVLDAVSHRVGAVHLSDLRRRGSFEPVEIGTGAAPLERLLRAVVASGFDGWLSVEEASRTGHEAFRAGVEAADRLWAAAGGRRRTCL